MRRENSTRPAVGAIVIVAAFGLLVSLLLFVPYNIRVNTSVWRRLLDAGHLPLFFVLAVLVSICVFSYLFKPARQFYLSFLSVSLLAGISELVQPYFGRSAGLNDWVNGSIGALLGSLFVFYLQQRASLILWLGFFVSLLFSGIFVLMPAYRAWQAAAWRDHNFPLLASFENAAEIFLWTSKLEQGHSDSAIIERIEGKASDGSYALAVTTRPGSYSGVSFDLGRLDITAHRQLQFDIFNPGRPFYLTLRIDDGGNVDEYGDRFNKELLVKRGWTKYVIPVEAIKRGSGERTLDVSDLRRAVFFVGKDEPSRSFVLDFVRVS